MDSSSDVEFVPQCSKGGLRGRSHGRACHRGMIWGIEHACLGFDFSSPPLDSAQRWCSSVRVRERPLGASVATADATAHSLFEIISIWESEHVKLFPYQTMRLNLPIDFDGSSRLQHKGEFGDAVRCGLRPAVARRRGGRRASGRKGIFPPKAREGN